MCGIAGVLALKDGRAPTLEALRRMAGAMRHRGPDEFGVYRDGHAGLAHARLSIIDLASGQQPLANEDETLWISFNGEIFNYLELKQELEALGHRFRTRSDTEVIVHAYEAWGDDAFSRFNGQWAIALWSSRERKLVLSRDRLGVRPLYLCGHGGRLYFASEVKAIFAADASIPRAFDPHGLDQTFTFWSAVAPRTPYLGIEELAPGHVRTYQGGKVVDRAFWSPSYPEGEVGAFPGALEDAARAVEAALLEATRLRMLRADVPVGSYLSGGLDSAFIAALGREVKGEKFRTFSVRFEDAEYDETPFQRAMAERLGTEHLDIVVRRDDIARVFPRVVLHAERPMLRTAPAPLFLLSGLVQDAGIKVVLTGEGADEMFGGYDLFREAKVRRFWARQPQSKLRPRLLERLYPYLARSPASQRAVMQQFFGRNLDRAASPGFSHAPRWQSAAALQRLFAAPLRASLQGHDAAASLLAELPEAFGRWAPLAQDQYLELRTLLSSYLLSTQGDRMLMAHSVEGRFPFLDANVIALAHSLPASFKLRGLDEKHVLKRAAKGRVPPEVLARKKQPYRAPDALSFVGPGRPEWVEEVLSERALADAQVFEVGAVRQLWGKCRTRAEEGQFSNADNMALVGILSVQLLHAQLIRQVPEPAEVALKTQREGPGAR